MLVLPGWLCIPCCPPCRSRSWSCPCRPSSCRPPPRCRWGVTSPSWTVHPGRWRTGRICLAPRQSVCSKLESWPADCGRGPAGRPTPSSGSWWPSWWRTDANVQSGEDFAVCWSPVWEGSPARGVLATTVIVWLRSGASLISRAEGAICLARLTPHQQALMSPIIDIYAGLVFSLTLLMCYLPSSNKPKTVCRNSHNACNLMNRTPIRPDCSSQLFSGDNEDNVYQHWRKKLVVN